MDWWKRSAARYANWHDSAFPRGPNGKRAQRPAAEPGPLRLNHDRGRFHDWRRDIHRLRRHGADRRQRRMVARFLGHYRIVDYRRGISLWRAGRDDAARRRPVRLFARSLVAHVRVPLRLDIFHGDPDRNHRRGGRGICPLYGHSVAAHFRKRVPHSAHPRHQHLRGFAFDGSIDRRHHHRAAHLE